MLILPDTPTALPCYMVNNLTHNSMEQCKFIIDNDCLESESAIDYVYWVYCEFGHELIYLSMFLIAFLVIVLFLALSSVADEFLCPSLLAVAKDLRMSDSLAGVTLLAFGNGCPDIFSSLAAASDDRSELIIGELLGAGIFCSSIVAGIIFIHSDFKLACRPTLRDTTFYLLAVYLIWLYCWSEEITFYGALAFILIYVIYLIVALSGQAIHSRLLGEYPIATVHTENTVKKDDGDHNESWPNWKSESLRRMHLGQDDKKSHETAPLTPTMKVRYNQNGVTSIHLGSDSLKLNTQPPVPLEVQLYQSTKPFNSSSSGSYINKAFIASNECELSERFEFPMKNDEQQKQQAVELVNSQPVMKRCKNMTLEEWDGFLAHINPIDTENWNQSKLINKIVAILRAPLFFAALITVPVVDYDRRHNNWCRLLNSLHCITVPLSLSLYAPHFGVRENFHLLGLPLPVLSLIPGVIMGAMVLKTSTPLSPPKYQPIFAYIGFIMSIFWVYILANEIISLLKTVGIMFSMSDTAIGLGVLAWGNSLGDIVANISLAEAGYPRMALGASIGAPLLNLLLGFGLSFTLSLKPGESSAIEYSPTITLLCSTLAIILFSLMLSTLAPPDRSKKPFGYLLIACYGVYFALAVCLEYGIINV